MRGGAKVLLREERTEHWISKPEDGQMMMFSALDLSVHRSLESSISLRGAGLQMRWKDGRRN